MTKTAHQLPIAWKRKYKPLTRTYEALPDLGLPTSHLSLGSTERLTLTIYLK